MKPVETLGFIGLGVMGEPMCANLIAKSERRVFGADTRPEPVARLAARGLSACGSVAEVAAAADVIFLSLPSGTEVEAVCLGDGGIAQAGGRAHPVVDMGTSPAKPDGEAATKPAERDI